MSARILLALAALFLSLTALPRSAQALPGYAQRSGRTCANCHVSPTLEDPQGWDNPRLMDRKCTLSCVSCHVDPTGGGLRNTSGVYYGQSTLSILPSQDRSYSDHHREILSEEQIWRVKQWLGKPPDTLDGAPDDGRIIPSDYQDALDGMGAGQTGGAAWGKPGEVPHELAFWDGRYDDLSADPKWRLGGDARVAWWSGTQSIFPMQIDLDAAWHPMEHLTFTATAAANGRHREGPPVFARRAFGMIHELPGMSWAKAGLFMPAFGTFIDDHTSFTRDWFEMDVSDPANTVAGVEIGTAPNYPFATVSAFKTGIYSREDEGYGGAASAGWRDLGWSLSGHAMAKLRPAGRGELYGAGVAWGLNPAYYADKIPITYLGELSLGRAVDAEGTRDFAAMTHEGWWTLRNGVALRGKADLGLKPIDRPEELQRRYALGLEVSPLPGLTVTGFGRALYAPGDTSPHPDLFVQTHLWF